MRRALIVGLAGATLTSGERSFLSSARPAGIILFARNCRDRAQLSGLVGAAKNAAGTDALFVLIDQEGGRVRRLRPPEWRDLPAAAAYGRFYETDPAGAVRAAHLAARLTAADLRDVGINVNCAPVLDVPVPGAHDIIGDRAYGRTLQQVTDLGRAVAEGFLAGGVVPVMKHIPGHGRAKDDSHLELPVVDAPRPELERRDFAPFRVLRDLPAAMTAHVVFRAVDPDLAASISPHTIATVVRGHIGFDGLLMSDDLNMAALHGSIGERAAAVTAAGNDLALHCSGNLPEMREAAAAVPTLEGRAFERFEACLAIAGARPSTFDVAEAEAGLATAMRA